MVSPDSLLPSPDSLHSAQKFVSPNRDSTAVSYKRVAESNHLTLLRPRPPAKPPSSDSTTARNANLRHGRNGLERRLQPAPRPERVAESNHLTLLRPRPPAKPPSSDSTTARNANLRHGRNGLERRLQPAPRPERVAESNHLTLLRPRPPANHPPLTAPRLATPISGTAETAWNAGFSRHRGPRGSRNPITSLSFAQDRPQTTLL